MPLSKIDKIAQVMPLKRADFFILEFSPSVDKIGTNNLVYFNYSMNLLHF